MRTITRTAVQGSFADDAAKARPAQSNYCLKRPRAANRLAPGRVPRRKGVAAVRRPLHLLALLLLVASCVVRSRVRRGRASPQRAAAAPAESTPAAKKIKVGLVTDIGGLNDRSFNQLANEGLERAKSELGVEARVLISKANSDYVPNLSTLAQQKYDLVIGVGFLMAEAMNTVAAKFPDTKFAIIDVDATALESKPTNVAGAAVQGAGGGLPRRLHGRPLPQGQRRRHRRLGRRPEDPAGRPLHRRLPGGREGGQPGRRRSPTATRRSSIDPAPCKELALNQIAEGAKVVFQVAGGCGLGALDAAKEKSVQGIGVDADQAYLGDHIMTSALKKVDVAVFDAIKARPGRHVQGRRQHDLRRQVGRRGHRRDQRGRGQVRRRRSRRSRTRSPPASSTDIPDTVK